MSAVLAEPIVAAAAMMIASVQPFDHAFATQRGAHLTATFDGTKADSAQLAATAHARGVTARGHMPITRNGSMAGGNNPSASMRYVDTVSVPRSVTSAKRLSGATAMQCACGTL